MPRRAREKCEHSIYHIMVKGNNKQDIFLDEDDKVEYLKRVKRYKEKYKAKIYAYCLMSNHVHLLVYDNGQDISKIMQSLNLSYVIYFNKKHDRSGHLFQDRFKSVMVKKDAYFVEVSKYIHLNPVKAYMAKTAEQYKWSSSSIYSGKYEKYEIIDNTRILAYFSADYKESIKLYAEYMYNKEVEEEVAATIESGYAEIRVKEIDRRVDIEKITQVLTDHFNIHLLQLLRRNNKTYSRQRDISIYIMALVGRMPYKQLGEIFHVKPATIGESIKRAINLMIEDKIIFEEVDFLLRKIE